MSHKAGFVNIIGNPNVGKSTLMNAIVGEKMSIITSKAQTTRHRITGIVNGDDFQIVFSDTPGIIQPKYKLQESMMRFVGTALTDADIILYVTDVYETFDKNEKYLERIKTAEVPVLVVINKIDQSNQEEVEGLVDQWKETVPKAEIMPISALKKLNVNFIYNRILELLPEGEAFYPKDQLTDKPERFFVTELIREKIFLNYKKEIPYSCEVGVEEFKEEENIIRIKSVIYVERDSQKGIIIGQQGKAIKKVGTEARLDMEAFFGKKIFLEMFVKVSKDWKNKITDLKRFGYYQ
jgi:GTPase